MYDLLYIQQMKYNIEQHLMEGDKNCRAQIQVSQYDQQYRDKFIYFIHRRKRMIAERDNGSSFIGQESSTSNLKIKLTDANSVSQYIQNSSAIPNAHMFENKKTKKSIKGRMMKKLSPKRIVSISPRLRDCSPSPSIANISLVSHLKLVKNKSEVKLLNHCQCFKKGAKQQEPNLRFQVEKELKKQKSSAAKAEKLNNMLEQENNKESTQRQETQRLQNHSIITDENKKKLKMGNSRSYQKNQQRYELKQRLQRIHQRQIQVEAKKESLIKMKADLAQQAYRMKEKEADIAKRIKQQQERQEKIKEQQTRFTKLITKHLKLQRQYSQKEFELKKEELVLKLKLKEIQQMKAQNSINEQKYILKNMELAEKECRLMESEIEFSKSKKALRDQKRKLQEGSKAIDQLINQQDCAKITKNEYKKSHSIDTVSRRSNTKRDEQQKQSINCLKKQIEIYHRRQEEIAEQYQLEEPTSQQDEISLIIEQLKERQMKLAARQIEINYREKLVCKQELTFHSIGEELNVKAEKIEHIHRNLSDRGVKGLRIRRFFFWKEGQNKCPICIDNFSQDELLTELRCRHDFHPNCIYKWLDKESKCPLCKTDQKTNYR